MSEIWPWAALIGLGLFHGLNPAMGWLFAVGLGLQTKRRQAVVRAVVPIALGHAASLAAVALVTGAARIAIAPQPLQIIAAAALLGFGCFRVLRGYRHKVRVGMQVEFSDLLLWSFFMATAHGAGLMIIPILLGLSPDALHFSHSDPHVRVLTELGGSIATGLAAVVLHTAAMLLATGVVAVVVFDHVGLAVLRRGWVNMDLIWNAALLGSGVVLLVLAAGWL